MEIEQLKKDLACCKALMYLGQTPEGRPDIKWVHAQVISGPNEHGQWQVRRLRDGFEGTTTKARHLNDKERAHIKATYL